MRQFLQGRLNSFRYAFAGIGFVICSQRNAWIHAAVSLIVIAASFWLRLSPTEWALIILAIALVWIAEFVNSALEAVVDLAARHEYHDLAKISKDIGAAAVLIAAGSSVAIGLLVLGPPLWARLH